MPQEIPGGAMCSASEPVSAQYLDIVFLKMANYTKPRWWWWGGVAVQSWMTEQVAKNLDQLEGWVQTHSSAQRPEK